MTSPPHSVVGAEGYDGRRLPFRRFKREHITGGGALFSGAFAGLCVDLSLFPLDTLKTRFQTEGAFLSSRTFRNLYAGVPSVLIGSAPGAALFFCSYETSKKVFLHYAPHPSLAHMCAASVGEIFACLVRVPTEVVKQRAQAYPKRGTGYVATITFEREGFRGFYRGYWSTIVREIPFSFIQFPIWEALKVSWTRRRDGRPVNPFQSAICGSFAGIIAAGLTTPLDVAKTRIMLAHKLHIHAEGKVLPVLRDIYSVEGFRGLFSGFLPRISWMGCGGFVFFGAYEAAKYTFLSLSAAESLEMDGATGSPLMEPLKRASSKLAAWFYKDRPKTFDEMIARAEEERARRQILMEQYYKDKNSEPKEIKSL